MVSGLTGYKEYRLSVVGVNYSGNAYNSTEITAWTEEGGTCNIPKYVAIAFFLGGGGVISRASQVHANKLLLWSLGSLSNNDGEGFENVS